MQVSGRGDIPFNEQVELDVQYIESRSLWFDIKLLFSTIPAVLLEKAPIEVGDNLTQNISRKGRKGAKIFAFCDRLLEHKAISVNP